jgi:hypothetical protein
MTEKIQKNEDTKKYLEMYVNDDGGFRDDEDDVEVEIRLAN